MKWSPLGLVLCTAALASSNPQLKQVQSIYILPMSGGMDQYLANRISRDGLFQVVTDPQKADAILTDRIGEPFERKLDELYPPPKPPDDEDTDEKDSDANAKSKDVSSLDAMAAASGTQHITSSLSRAKGTIFLVDRKTRAVVWSTYDRPHDLRPDGLNRTADQIVGRLKRDVKDN